jgi:palmitoyltransferase
MDGGYTPLHLGVISGNSRLVRKLLIKGVDKNILDKLGKKPIDIARDQQFNNIEIMLAE